MQATAKKVHVFITVQTSARSRCSCRKKFLETSVKRKQCNGKLHSLTYEDPELRSLCVITVGARLLGQTQTHAVQKATSALPQEIFAIGQDS